MRRGHSLINPLQCIEIIYVLKVLGTPRAARLTTIKTNVRLGDAVGPIHFTAIIAIIINTITIIIITIIIVFISSS